MWGRPLVLLLVLQLGAWPLDARISPSVNWLVDPLTVKVMSDRRAPFASSSRAGLDMAAQRGECERQQIWGWNDSAALKNVQLEFADLRAPGGAVLARSIWSWKQQGYVNATATQYYKCNEDLTTGKWNSTRMGDAPWEDGHFLEPSTDATYLKWPFCTPGWYPDALLDVPEDGVPLIPRGVTQPLFVEACVPYGVLAGNYSGAVKLTATARTGGERFTLADVPIALEVWDIDVPAISDSSAFDTAFAFGPIWCTQFGDCPDATNAWYPNMTHRAISNQWMRFLVKHRIPGDDMYLLKPRPLQEYIDAADIGIKNMNLLNAGLPSYVINQTSQRPYANKSHINHTVESLLNAVEPTVESLRSLGLLQKAYIYGWDELPYGPYANLSIRTVFGAFKERYPDLRTMATINWPTICMGCHGAPATPSSSTMIGSGGGPNGPKPGDPDGIGDDFPIDIWVMEYGEYGQSDHYRTPTHAEKARQRWLAADPNHRYWWYWCLSPRPPELLNTFVERPAIDTRLMYWLAALHGIDGMLYYAVNLWYNQCDANHLNRPCKPMERIRNTAMTDFNPAMYPETKGPAGLNGGANGEGNLMYPGPDGPLASNRLILVADGIEDWQLFRRLGLDNTSISNGDDLITQLIRNMTSRTGDPALLEHVRRQAARRVMAMVAA